MIDLPVVDITGSTDIRFPSGLATMAAGPGRRSHTSISRPSGCSLVSGRRGGSPGCDRPCGTRSDGQSAVRLAVHCSARLSSVR
jgi:hypothetical protein